MKALILDTQVCQVEQTDFPVAPPLVWVECPDDCTTQWTYVDGVFVPYVAPVPTAVENKATAAGLLSATDWTTIADVASPINSPYLTNQAEFISYRNIIRGIAVNPIAGDLTWPTVPTENWVKV